MEYVVAVAVAVVIATAVMVVSIVVVVVAIVTVVIALERVNLAIILVAEVVSIHRMPNTHSTSRNRSSRSNRIKDRTRSHSRSGPQLFATFGLEMVLVSPSGGDGVRTSAS